MDSKCSDQPVCLYNVDECRRPTLKNWSLVRKCLRGEPPGNARIYLFRNRSLNLETVVDIASLSFSVCTLNIETEKIVSRLNFKSSTV